MVGTTTSVARGERQAQERPTSASQRSGKIELDQAPREVELPEALADALANDAKARAAFDRLSYTHRKEYARWVGEARREETQQRRVAQALERLRQGKPATRPSSWSVSRNRLS